MTLSVHNGAYLSASILNEWSRILLEYFSWCGAAQFPLETRPTAYSADNDGTHVTVWSGFLLYTGDTDTFRYSIYHVADGGAETANTEIKVNGTIIATFSDQPGATQEGTVDISSLGLTAGQVYSVTTESWRSGTSATVNLTADVYWLGLSKTISYTTPPSLTNGTVLTSTHLSNIRSGIVEIGQVIAMPVAPMVIRFSGTQSNSGSEVTIWRGYFYYQHDTLNYHIQAGSDYKNCNVKIYVYGTSPTGGDITFASADVTKTGTVDISGLGLTRGVRYKIHCTMRLTGTSGPQDIFANIWRLYFTTDTTPNSLNVWAHGGQDVSAANINFFGTLIDTIHPGASSPTTPLYYHQPAVRTSDNSRYYLHHRQQFLRYRPTGGKTAELNDGTNITPLPGASGNCTHDLSGITTLTVGQYYHLDDCEFSQEYDTEQPD